MVKNTDGMEICFLYGSLFVFVVVICLMHGCQEHGMNEQEWLEECTRLFAEIGVPAKDARHLAETCLENQDGADDYTPKEAVDCEISYWDGE